MAGHERKDNAHRAEEKLETLVSVVYIYHADQQSKRPSECVSRLF